MIWMDPFLLISLTINYFFVAEVCHMLKLARNALADVKGFVEYEGRQIKWDYIKSLHKIQEEECFKSLHKINLHKVT